MTNFKGMRVKVLIIRVALGLMFALILVRLFFPAATKGTFLLIAGLLVFFAYVLESVHKKRTDD